MISSVTNAAVKKIVLLQSKDRTRREEGLFITEGVRMFAEVPPERLEEVYVTESFLDRMDNSVRERLKTTGYEVVSDDVMKKMSDTQTPQGILTVVRAKNHTLEDIIADGRLFVILDSLQDPGNLGTIFRTAEAAGASGIIMSRDTVSIYNPKSVRSTMGTLFRMPFVYTEDLCDAIRAMQEKGIRIYAAHLAGRIPYTEPDYTHPSAFIIGNEGNGISDAAAACADSLITIPMEGEIESLNASIAASLLLYESHRQNF